MSPLFAAILTFITTLFLVIGAWTFARRREFEASRRANNILEEKVAPLETTTTLVRDQRVSQVEWINRHLSQAKFTATLSDRLRRADLKMRPGHFLLLTVLFAVIGFLIGSIWGWMIELLLAAIFATIPPWWLGRRCKKRLAKFENQLPEAIDMLVSAMRAGYSFQMAAKFLADEMPAPLGLEFSRFYDEQRLGVETRTALRGLEERTPSLDLKMFVTAVLIVRESGGNLSEVLGNLGGMMRVRIAMRGQIETLIAEPKMSAKFLSCLPVIVFIGLIFLSPDLMMPFIHAKLGQYLLAGAATSAFLGYLVMMKIADVDF